MELLQYILMIIEIEDILPFSRTKIDATNDYTFEEFC